MDKEEIKQIYTVYAEAWKMYREILMTLENTDACADETYNRMMKFEEEHPEEKWFAHELMTVFYARLTGRK